MKTGKYRVSEAAYDSGFSSPKNFTTAFKKKYGMAPLEYMKQLKNK